MDICVITEDALLARFIELELTEAGYSVCTADRSSEALLYICDLDGTATVPKNAIGFSYHESKRTQVENFLLRPIDVLKLKNAVANLLDVPSHPKNSVIEVEKKTRKAKAEKGEVRLSEKELALLCRLADSRILTREDGKKIFEDSDTNVVDVYMHYLRKKLSKVHGGEAVKSLRGKGYILSDAVTVKFT